MKLNGRDVLIGVESEPVKTMDGFCLWHRLSINKLTTGHWLGETCLGLSGSLGDCSGSVTVSYRSEKVVAEIYEMYI